MSKYHKTDPNKYPNIFGCNIINRTNIQIYLDATYLPSKYPNIFGRPKIYEQISKHICTGEMSRIWIQILFEGHFNQIYEYLNICAQVLKCIEQTKLTFDTLFLKKLPPKMQFVSFWNFKCEHVFWTFLKTKPQNWTGSNWYGFPIWFAHVDTPSHNVMKT